MRKQLYGIFLVILLAGCDTCSKKKITIAEWAVAIDESSFHSGQVIEARLKYIHDEIAIDSVVYIFNGEEIASNKDLKQAVKVPTAGLSLGSHTIKGIVYKDGEPEVHSANFILLSDKKPEEIIAVAAKVYPHSTDNFTEGFFVHDGMFYESTGLNGKSYVYRYKPGSTSLEKLVTMDSLYFGEGIVWFDDKMYQLTWQGGHGFVYDVNTWKTIKEFHYGTEGWGFTHDGKNLIMSDGSNRLFYLDPATLSIQRILEACDDMGKVINLNELEYVDGFIYANIWQTEKIAKIDASNGKVVAILNCEKLMDESEVTSDTKEMNGIAYDPVVKKLYITGKNWPKIYELTLVP
jgi:glutamine cyclotransferase